MKFGDNLRNLRKSKKFSQEDLSELVGVSRQSISKWENSEAYPEMTNILILCKIFNIEINDLLSDKLSDIESFDEEVKMSLVKFEKEKQKKMKTLSKILSVIGKIGGIVVKVCIPFVILSMILIPIVLSNLDYVDNKIISKNNDFEIQEHSNLVNITYKGHTVVTDMDDTSVDKLETILSGNKTVSIVRLEIGFSTLVVFLVILSMLLKHLEELFTNINKGDTPFTLENVNHIKKMSYFMIACIVLSGFGEGILNTSINDEFTFGIETFDIVEIIFLYALSYIFEYGYEIQKDSKGVMYDE